MTPQLSHASFITIGILAIRLILQITLGIKFMHDDRDNYRKGNLNG